MHYLIFSLIVIITGLNVEADISSESYEHFTGVYAYETTPYWPEFEITRTGNTFTLQPPDSQENKLILKLSNNTLKGIVEGRDLVITYDPDKKHYVLDTSTLYVSRQGTITVPIQHFLAKALANPNEKLEKEYGVSAAEIVNRVRQSEKWIHEIETLQIFANDKWIKTPEGIEDRKRELIEQSPETDVNELKLRELAPEVNGKLEVAFDKKRFRRFIKLSGFEERMQRWDGRQFISYVKVDSYNQEEYLIEPELGTHGNFFFADFMWPRSEFHDFWWMDIEQNDLSRGDWYGNAEDFILTGKQDYRGTECYVIECEPKDYHRIRRWYVGVQDRLLYGNLVYEEGRKFREHWTINYNKDNPDYSFPMKQGYYLFHHGEKMEYVVSGWRELDIEKILINEKLPQEWFDLQLKEGVKVADSRFGGFVTYEYKKDMKDQEWEEVYQRARERAERDATTKEALDARIGQAALEFPKGCKWLNTGPLTWKSLRGKAVILQFWGNWCGPCKNYMGMIKDRKQDDKTVLIGVHTPESGMNAIKEVISKYNADGPVCVDLPSEQSVQSWGRISSWFAVNGIPYWIVIGPKGTVVGHADNPGEAFTLANKVLSEVK